MGSFVLKGENCIEAFEEKESEIRKNLHPMMILAVNENDDDDCGSKERRCIDVLESPLLWTRERIEASLTVNVEEEAIDQEMLESIAIMTGVKPDKIRLSIGPKSSTFVMLLLPPQAGMELLSVVTNSKRKRLFLNSLSSTIHSPAEFVSVLVQISTVPPMRMYFVPKTATIHQDDPCL